MLFASASLGSQARYVPPDGAIWLKPGWRVASSTTFKERHDLGLLAEEDCAAVGSPPPCRLWAEVGDVKLVLEGPVGARLDLYATGMPGAAPTVTLAHRPVE